MTVIVFDPGEGDKFQYFCGVRALIIAIPTQKVSAYYAPPLIGGALSDAFVWRLTFVWRLSIAYIGPKWRTERRRKTKIGTEVAHVTHDSDTTFKVKRSKVKVTRPLYSPPCWRVRLLQWWAWERVGREKLLLCCRLFGRARLFGAHGGGRRGERAYRGGRPPTACYVHVCICYCGIAFL